MQASRFLVTGGSQGIGAAIVELARKGGHEVVFTGRNEQRIPTPGFASDPAWSPLLTST